MQYAKYVNQLTEDCRSVVAVIVDTHWTPPIISVLNFAKWFSSKKFIPNISALKILKPAPKCRRVKGWIKLNKRKTDHKSKFGVFPNLYFQACRKVIPISCRGQQAQT